MINFQKLPKDAVTLNHLLPAGPESNRGGGPCELPFEFDSKRFASAYHPKGAGVNAARGVQNILGTQYSAPGWQVWTYPKERGTGIMDEKTGDEKMEKHPMAGQPHEVTLAGGKESGGTYVLMFRPIEIQDQVNLVCALRSREMMEADLRGVTVGGNTPDTGLVTEQVLRKQMGTEGEPDLAMPNTVVHGGVPFGGRITSPVVRVSR